MFEQRRAERTGKVVPSLAPVETGATKRAALVLQSGSIDAGFFEKSPAIRGKRESVSAQRERAAFEEALKDLHTQFAGEVVVANARLAQGWIARTGPQAQRTRAKSHPHQLS